MSEIIGRLLVQDAFAIFHELEGKNKGPNYRYGYIPLIEFFKDRFLDTLTKVDIQDYRIWRAKQTTRSGKPVMESTINREQSVITRLINAFNEWKGLGIVGSYRFDNLPLPRDNPGEQVKKANERAFTRTNSLTPMEFFRFCDYAHPRVRVIAILSILTLLRKKNLKFLDKDKFNSALQQIQVVQSKTKVPIAVPASMTVRVIIEDSKYDCICDFTNFRRLRERAHRESGVNFWLTDLRRTGATQMLLDGIDLRTIQKYLGHTTLVMTERYLQPPAKHMVEAANRLEDRFSSSIELAIPRP